MPSLKIFFFLIGKKFLLLIWYTIDEESVIERSLRRVIRRKVSNIDIKEPSSFSPKESGSGNCKVT